MKLPAEIGVYNAGFASVRLLAGEGTGGAFDSFPGLGKLPEITVGIEEKDWWRVVSWLSHEIHELMATKLLLRFSASGAIARDSGEYLFVMDHTQFGELIARSANFIAESLPDLREAHKKHHKPK